METITGVTFEGRELAIMEFLHRRVFDPALASPRATKSIKWGVGKTIIRMEQRRTANAMIKYFWAAVYGTENSIRFADTELRAKDLLNNRMAYVAVSRGAYDAQIFTNDREKLGGALGHDVSHSSAHAPEMKPEQKQEQAVTQQREIAPKQEQGEDFGLGL